MKLLSSAFSDMQLLPNKYGKKNENASPPLVWEDIPSNTKSFALCMKDLHPVAKGLIHWLIIDIDGNISSLKEGVSGTNNIPDGSKEVKVYRGPNPPSGTHDYEFTIYALKTENLVISQKATREEIGKILFENSIATAKLIGKFTRAK